MLEKLKEKVCEANLLLKQSGLITLTWGNVSEIDRQSGLVVIKPSGVSYNKMTPADMVVVDLDGNTVEGDLNPSSDLPTHLELYKAFSDIGGVTHTHSRWATIFSQAGVPLDALGTTHADTFYGTVPCTRRLSAEEIASDYEKNTGKIIVEAFENLDPNAIPAVLVNSHGPFIWGKTALKSVENAIVLEECAMMAYYTKSLSPNVAIQQELVDKHYLRKHGKNAYYGQKGYANDN